MDVSNRKIHFDRLNQRRPRVPRSMGSVLWILKPPPKLWGILYNVLRNRNSIQESTWKLIETDVFTINFYAISSSQLTLSS